MTSINTHAMPVAGDVSINILHAVKKALAAAPRPRSSLNRQIEYMKRRLDKAESSLRTLTLSTKRPIRYRYHVSSRMMHEPAERKKARIRRELLDAGVTMYGLLKAESRYLHRVMHDHEHIEAVVYGQHQSSSVMLIATDERIIFLDKKPMVTMFDELSYEVVSGIEFDVHTLFATLVLHSPVKNYDIRFANLHCAEKFARHIEKQRLEHEEEKPQAEVIDLPKAGIDPDDGKNMYPFELKEDMAGYYWLPAEEEERRRIQGEIV